MSPHARNVACAAVATALLAVSAMAEDPPKAPAPPPRVRLTVSPRPGQRFVLQDDVEGSVKAFGGMEINLALHQLTTLGVDAVSPEGTATMRQKVARIWGGVSMPSLDSIEFDTDDPKSFPAATPAGRKETKSMGAGLWTANFHAEGDFAAALSAETVLRIDADGTSWRRRDAAADKSDELGDPARLGKLPDHPVAVGDAWDADGDLSMSWIKGTGALRTKLRHVVTAIDAESVTVAHEGTVSAAADVSAKMGDEKALCLSMRTKSSSVKGRTRISRQDGLTLESDLEIAADFGMGFGDETSTDTMFDFQIRVKTHQERRPALPEPAEKAKPREASTPADAPKPSDPPKPGAK